MVCTSIFILLFGLNILYVDGFQLKSYPCSYEFHVIKRTVSQGPRKQCEWHNFINYEIYSTKWLCVCGLDIL